jgi:hypothetical protein
MQEVKECYICKSVNNLHFHHIYFGKKRKISDKNGFTCYLCYDHHEGTNGVHGLNGHNLDMYLKKTCQEKFERLNTRQDFMRLICKNYLE